MSGVEFLSSDKQLCRGFSWARKQAMEYVRDQAAAGPCYEAALPGRDAFCMRDAAHQSGGAQEKRGDRALAGKQRSKSDQQQRQGGFVQSQIQERRKQSAGKDQKPEKSCTG